MSEKSERANQFAATWVAPPVLGLAIGVGLSSIALHTDLNIPLGVGLNVVALGLSAAAVVSKKARNEAPHLSMFGAGTGAGITGGLGYSVLERLSYI